MKSAIITDINELSCCNVNFNSYKDFVVHCNKKNKKDNCNGDNLLKDILLKLYIDEKLKQLDISNIIGISVATIIKLFKKYNIKSRKSHKSWCAGMKLPPAWNKGLKKDDPRVLSYVSSGAKTKRLKYQSTQNINDIVRGLPEYKEWRDTIFARDNYKSILSGLSGELQAHHKKSLSLILSDLKIKDPKMSSEKYDDVIDAIKNCKELWDTNNGVTLLKEEHKIIHMKKEIKNNVVITGVQGQDGSYLAEHLLELGYNVIGITRRKSTEISNENLKNVLSNKNFKLIYGSITDSSFINFLIQEYKPEKYFNLAAASHVGQSFIEPNDTFATNAGSVVIALDAIKRNSPHTRFYQASTSELYGGLNCPETGYTEESPFHPRSPYGVAKLAAHWATINFREAYGMFACAGILHNHESPRRGLDFVTRKVTNGVARIKAGLDTKIVMGNMDAYRDWGYAKDYVRMMNMMLDADVPQEYVIATGKVYSIEQLAETAFGLAGIKNWKDYIQTDEKFMRPSEVPYLLGNPEKARKELNWVPETSFYKLIELMLKEDLKRYGL